MCAQRLSVNNPPPAPRLFILLGSLLTSNIQPLTSAFPCAPLTQALALDSCFSHQSPACPEHQRRVTAHQSHAALFLFAGGWGVGCWGGGGWWGVWWGWLCLWVGWGGLRFSNFDFRVSNP